MSDKPYQPAQPVQPQQQQQPQQQNGAVSGATNNTTQNQPDLYQDQNIINLNSSRYRGLGKRRRLRNDLRSLGRDAVVWNGKNLINASQFSNGQQFDRSMAMDMIRNGKQNDGMYSRNDFQSGSIEADANQRVHDYFAQNPSSSRANWNHGNWQRPQQDQNTAGANYGQNPSQNHAQQGNPVYNRFAQQLQSMTGQQPYSFQNSLSSFWRTSNNQQQPTQSVAQHPVQPARRQANHPQRQPRNSFYKGNARDLQYFQKLVGLYDKDRDGIWGNKTAAKFNTTFGKGWRFQYNGDGTTAVVASDGTAYFNNGRYWDPKEKKTRSIVGI